MDEQVADKQRNYLERIETGGDLALTRYEPRNLPSLMDFSQMVARSQLCPSALQGKPQDVALVLMTGAERGFTAMQSLQNVYVIYGRTSISASLMRALVLRDPMCEEFRATKLTEESATIVVRRKDWPEGVREEVTYTVEQAKKAGYYDRKDSRWPKEPGSMCLARATTRATDAYFPNVKAGLMEATEAEDLAFETGRPQAASATAQATAAKLAAGAQEAVRQAEPPPAPDDDVIDVEATAPQPALAAEPPAVYGPAVKAFAKEVLKVDHMGEKNTEALVLAGFDSWEKINAAGARQLTDVKGVGGKAAYALILEATKHAPPAAEPEAAPAAPASAEPDEEEKAAIAAEEAAEAEADKLLAELPHRPNFRPVGSPFYVGLQGIALKEGIDWHQVQQKARVLSGGYPVEKLNDAEWKALNEWVAEGIAQRALVPDEAPAAAAQPAERRFEIGEITGEVVAEARVKTLLKYASRPHLGVVGGQDETAFRVWLQETFGVDADGIPVELEVLLMEWTTSSREEYEEVLAEQVEAGVLKEVAS